MTPSARINSLRPAGVSFNSTSNSNSKPIQLRLPRKTVPSPICRMIFVDLADCYFLPCKFGHFASRFLHV